jgi:hypothetical protein
MIYTYTTVYYYIYIIERSRTAEFNPQGHPHSAFSCTSNMSGTRLVTHLAALKFSPELSKSMDHPCTQKCHHGGTCALGKPRHGFQTEELGDEVTSVRPWHESTTLMHCVCPRGFAGLYCEIKLVECPSSGLCFDDKKCRMSEDDAGHPFSHCECDGQKSDLSQPYALHFCGGTSRVPCRTVSGHSFCQNGGRCHDDPQE